MLVGRAEERARIDRLLADARTRSSAVLVLCGEPGIGKTALLDHARAEARERDMAVLAARGVEAEAQVPFAGLLELLRPALATLDRLPEPQADALRSALALGPAREIDRFAIGAATLSLLAAQSEDTPLLVAVDDAHWLDGSSLAALLFATRRLVVDPIAVLFAIRAGEAPAIERAGLPGLELSPVDDATAAAIVARHTPAPLAPAAAARVLRAAGGNPLALVELAAGGEALERHPPGAPLAVQTSVAAAYARRLEGLTEAERAILMVAAAEGSGELSVIAAAAAELGLELPALEVAERAGLIALSPGRADFRHALIRSAAYHAAPPDERRAAHRAIAAALDHPSQADRRAWHLAAAALGPDEPAAQALDEAARRARGRSAYDAAAAAAERAAHLTSAGEDRARRLLAAAEAAWLSGDTQRSDRALDDALAMASEPRLRARIQRRRGEAALRAGRVLDARNILVAGAETIAGGGPTRVAGAETIAGGGPTRVAGPNDVAGADDAAAADDVAGPTDVAAADRAEAAVMYAQAAEACVYAGRPEPMLEVAERAWALLPEAAGEVAAFFARLALGTALVYNGRGAEGAAHLREAVAILEGSDVLGQDPRLLSTAALGPLWLRETAAGRGLVERAIETARSQSALGELPFALVLAGRDAATSDRWATAEALYEEAERLARETEQTLSLAAALSGRASLDARRGREQPCRAHAAEALELAGRHRLGFFELWALDGLAELELAAGRPAEAAGHLRAKLALLERLGVRDPDVSPVPELVEALVRLNRADEAHDDLERFAALAATKGQPWVLARAERAHAVLSGLDGRSSFDDRFAAALDHHARTPDRFEEARTRLLYGERLRRARQRARARVELRTAIDTFDALGAEPWATRARAELAATGETARRRDATTLDQLTPQELQIVLALGGGQTTREAATKLFLSPKTVEYHLRNAYRKLGVHSRDALADAVRDAVQDPP